MKISAWIFILASAGLATTADAEGTAQQRSRKTLVAQAEAAVKKQLRHPDSAKFEILGFAKGDGNDIAVVCGTVNAKNGFGGYAGPHLFGYLLGKDPADNKAAIVDDMELRKADLDSKAALESKLIAMVIGTECKPENYIK